MKKIIKIIIATLLLAPCLAFATATSVDRLNGNHIEPIIKNDFIQGRYFYATSTTDNSIFNSGINLRIFTGTDAFAGGLAWNAALFGNNASNIFVAGNTTTGGFFTFCTNNDATFGDISCSGNAKKSLTVASGGSTFDNTGTAAPLISAHVSIFGTGGNGMFLVAKDASVLNLISPSFYIANSGFTGIGTSSPYAPLSVVGEVVARNFTATSTNVLDVSSFKATSVQTLRIEGLSNGCLNITAKIVGSTSCGGGGISSDSNWTFFNNSGIQPATSTNQVLIGGTSTTSSANLEVQGLAYLGGKVGVATTSPFALLSVDTGSLGTTPALVIGSSTKTSFIVDNGGNVGVGTTSPIASLAVKALSNIPAFTASSQDGSQNFVIDSTGNVHAGAGFLTDANHVFLMQRSSTLPNPYGFKLENLDTGAAGFQMITARLAASNAWQCFVGSEAEASFKCGQDNVIDAFAITSNLYGGGPGLFGINNNAPAYRLDVGGDIHMSGNYVSADGTAGFTGTCTILGLTSVEVKNGIITNCI